MAREDAKQTAGLKAHVEPPPPAARLGDPEKDALRARVEELERQLKTASAQPAPAHGAETPGGKRGPVKPRLWEVSLDGVIKGFKTPSPYFAAEHPGDPRGEPIRAYDEVEARAVFRRIHAIEGGPNPECREITEEEARDAVGLPAEAKARRKAARERAPAHAGVPAVAGRTEEQERAAREDLVRAVMA